MAKIVDNTNRSPLAKTDNTGLEGISQHKHEDMEAEFEEHLEMYTTTKLGSPLPPQPPSQTSRALLRSA